MSRHGTGEKALQVSCCYSRTTKLSLKWRLSSVPVPCKS